MSIWTSLGELAPDGVQEKLHERVGVGVGVGLGVSVEAGDHRVDGTLVSDGHDPRLDLRASRTPPRPRSDSAGATVLTVWSIRGPVWPWALGTAIGIESGLGALGTAIGIESGLGAIRTFTEVKASSLATGDGATALT